MNKAFRWSWTALFCIGCSTDFSVTTDWQDMTIVYGLLDASDTAHYVKVNKAYLDPTTSALELAQIPDSLFYEQLDVVLQQKANGQVIQTIPLTRVDGNLEGYQKDSGIFAAAPNWLYKTKEPLDPASDYILRITQPDNGKQVTAETPIVNDFAIIRPTASQKINLLPGLKYNVSWTSARDGKIYALTMNLNYREYRFSNPSFQENKSAQWVLFTSERSTNTAGGQNMDYDLLGDHFYNWLRASIDENPDAYRIITSADFYFAVGAETLDLYNQVFLAQQGLTSNQVLTTFTNVENGLGIFSSRYRKVVRGVAFENRTLDSIACMSLTKPLNFLRSNGTLCP